MPLTKRHVYFAGATTKHEDGLKRPQRYSVIGLMVHKKVTVTIGPNSSGLQTAAIYPSLCVLLSSGERRERFGAFGIIIHIPIYIYIFPIQ